MRICHWQCCCGCCVHCFTVGYAIARLWCNSYVESILPKVPYPPCLRMADMALLAGYPRCMQSITRHLEHELEKILFHKAWSTVQFKTINTPCIFFYTYQQKNLWDNTLLDKDQYHSLTDVTTKSLWHALSKIIWAPFYYFINFVYLNTHWYLDWIYVVLFPMF